MWKEQVRKSGAKSATNAKKSNKRERNKNRRDFAGPGKFEH